MVAVVLLDSLKVSFKGIATSDASRWGLRALINGGVRVVGFSWESCRPLYVYHFLKKGNSLEMILYSMWKKGNVRK